MRSNMRYLLAAIIFCLSGNIYGEANSASLMATIQFVSDTPEKYQVGSSLGFKCKVKNLGMKSSPEGKLWIQFQYPKPLENQPESQLFKTEVVDIPSIQPGEQFIAQFKATQVLPNLFDFVKKDWGMREYEVVFQTDDKEYVIGNARLTFSGYYYEAPKRRTPVTVP